VLDVGSLSCITAFSITLSNRKIKAPFPVLEPHCIETEFTHLPSKQQKQQLSKLGVHCTYKKFTSDDDKIIRKN
jgi:hypothetical protein